MLPAAGLAFPALLYRPETSATAGGAGLACANPGSPDYALPRTRPEAPVHGPAIRHIRQPEPQNGYPTKQYRNKTSRSAHKSAPGNMRTQTATTFGHGCARRGLRRRSRRAGNAGCASAASAGSSTPAARDVMPAVRLPDADRRQPHQRLWITSKAPTAKTGWDQRACAQGWITPRAMRASRNRPDDRGRLHHGPRTSFTGALWLIAVGALCVAFAFLYHGRPLPAGLPRLGRPAGAGLLRFVPVGRTSYVLSGGWTWQTASFRRPAGWRSTPC